jgi:antirestriction protein ArdC
MKDANIPRQDIYSRVTDRIIATLEQGFARGTSPGP